MFWLRRSQRDDPLGSFPQRRLPNAAKFGDRMAIVCLIKLRGHSLHGSEWVGGFESSGHNGDWSKLSAEQDHSVRRDLERPKHCNSPTHARER